MDSTITTSLTSVATEAVKPLTASDELNLDPLVERLTARTSDAEAALSVRTVVEEVAHRFDDAPVRTFLPVLIMKQAEDQLSALGLTGVVALADRVPGG